MRLLGYSKLKTENERLTSELAAATEKLKAFEAGDADHKALIEANDAIAAKLEQFECDLLTAKQTIGALTKEKDDALAKASDFEVKVTARATEMAAIKAAEITAKLGQPPIPAAPQSGTEPPKPEAKGRDRFLAAFKVS